MKGDKKRALLPKTEKVMSFLTCTLHQILLGISHQEGWDGRCMWQAWGV